MPKVNCHLPCAMRQIYNLNSWIVKKYLYNFSIDYCALKSPLTVHLVMSVQCLLLLFDSKVCESLWCSNFFIIFILSFNMLQWKTKNTKKRYRDLCVRNSMYIKLTVSKWTNGLAIKRVKQWQIERVCVHKSWQVIDCVCLQVGKWESVCALWNYL